MSESVATSAPMSNVPLVYHVPERRTVLVCACKHENLVPPRLRSAEGFCEVCDRPLFYVDLRRGIREYERIRESERIRGQRRPGVRGLERENTKKCPTCNESNQKPVEEDKWRARCHRDGARLYPDTTRPVEPGRADADAGPPEVDAADGGSTDPGPATAGSSPRRRRRWPRILGLVALGDAVLAATIVALYLIF